MCLFNYSSMNQRDIVNSSNYCMGKLWVTMGPDWPDPRSASPKIVNFSGKPLKNEKYSEDEH